MSRIVEIILEAYFMGNTGAAKSAAKRTSERMIEQALREDYGRTESEARAVAAYLKGRGTFQAACDAGAKGKV